MSAGYGRHARFELGLGSWLGASANPRASWRVPHPFAREGERRQRRALGSPTGPRKGCGGIYLPGPFLDLSRHTHQEPKFYVGVLPSHCAHSAPARRVAFATSARNLALQVRLVSAPTWHADSQEAGRMQRALLGVRLLFYPKNDARCRLASIPEFKSLVNCCAVRPGYSPKTLLFCVAVALRPRA